MTLAEVFEVSGNAPRTKNDRGAWWRPDRFEGIPPEARAENYFRITFCIMGMASSQVMPLSMNMQTVVPHGATVNM